MLVKEFCFVLFCFVLFFYREGCLECTTLANKDLELTVVCGSQPVKQIRPRYISKIPHCVTLRRSKNMNVKNAVKKMPLAYPCYPYVIIFGE